MEHLHDFSHTHEDPAHARAPEAPSDPAQVRALLSYMIQHNQHHAEELAELADRIPTKARKKLLLAIGTFEAANIDLQEVLDILS